MQGITSVTVKFLVSCLLLLAVLACAETITGKVVGVMDGDTIEVLDATNIPRRVRLEGIDAPEKAQPFGARSKQHLSDQVFGKQVEVQSNKTDKYGRTVGKVMIVGKDANLDQVRSGFAWHYKEYQKEQSAGDRLAYANAKTSARNMKSGLWNDSQPMPPWEWRHGGKTETTAQSSDSGCPCGGTTFCTGSRGGQYCIAPGGQYCIAPSGKKKY